MIYDDTRELSPFPYLSITLWGSSIPYAVYRYAHSMVIDVGRVRIRFGRKTWKRKVNQHVM